MPSPLPNGPLRKAPLRALLVVPFVALLAVAVTLTGYLSFRNGKNAVNEVVLQLRNHLIASTEDHLDAFLSPLHRINQLNADAFRRGLLDARDPTALERHFWEQIQICDSVTSFYFGNIDGGLVDAGREGPSGPMYVIATDGFVSGPFKKYATDSRGNRTDLLATVPDFDARTRPWYVKAVEEDKATWSEIYILYTGQDMAIAASLPVYDGHRNLLGVVSGDIFLSHINDFLKSLEIGKSGQGFIMERSGLLVASSSGEAPFIKPEEGRTPLRLHASESGNRLIRGAAGFLAELYGDYRRIDGMKYLDLSFEGQRHFLQVSPIGNAYGLEWLMAIVIPETDFMAQIDANNRTTVFLIVCTLAAAICVGIAAARLISRPITQLHASTRDLARNQWPEPLHANSRIREISALTQSFNTMAGRLRQSLESLSAEIAERRLIESDLRANRDRLDLVIKGADLGVWDRDFSTGIVVRNSKWAEILGYAPSEIEPDPSGWEKLIHPEDVERVMTVLNDHLKGHTEICHIEARLRAKSGEWKWILDTGKVIARDEQGRPVRATGIIQDISDRKIAEAAILSALKEKEILLREIHHRVKNNLQVVVSLLNLQAGHLKNPAMAEALQASQQRIRAMAVIHETLHGSPNLAAIQLSSYLTNLVNQLIGVFTGQTAARITVEADEILLNIDQAIACGLIINELVTNALKYAFPGIAGGRIHVSARLTEDLQVRLAVCDNGVGLSSDFDLSEASSLGLQLVRGLVEHQLAGTCRVEVNGGSAFTIQWPLQPDKA